MSIFARRIHFSLVLVALIASCAIDVALADSPSVTAVLSNSEAGVGETVRLQVRVTGGRNADVPGQIAVDGLEINRTGTSQHFEMNNFNVTSSVIYDYTILPMKAGTFKIPPQTIHVAGKSLSTPELTLHVIDSPNATARSNHGSSHDAQTASASKLVFAELIVPKKTAFVGEMVPVVVRIGFFVTGQLSNLPEIKVQGFTMHNLQGSNQPEIESINGRRCRVWTFKTAIAAIRSGKFEIGPVQANAVVVVARQRPRSPRDIFGMDDVFPDLSDMFDRQEPRSALSESVTLEVKPLPPNAPPNFSGAVGNFTMTTDAKPTSVQVGDPITVTSTITGRGNFDRVNAPILENEHGWHKYPPSSKFKQDDDVGISGAKSFETVISPNEKKQAVPPFVFTYFDPAKENYVTLRSEAAPIQVEGGVVPTPSIAEARPSAPAVAAIPQEKPADILYQLSDVGSPRSFQPLYVLPIFWTAQLVPLIGLLGFVGWKIRQARIDNREAQRIAALQHEATELMRKLRRDGVSPQEYYAEASRIVRVRAALARNIDPNSVDFETAATAFQLNPDSRERLRQLFERSDELQYSGAYNGAKTISPENRREVLELLEDLRT